MPAYALRFVQYLDLMLLFGLPLFSFEDLMNQCHAIELEANKQAAN